MSPQQRQGILYALACYGAWGLFPAFWKLVASVPPVEVLAHRVVWSLAAVALLLAWRGGWGEIRVLLAARRRILALALSTACISINWLVFIQVVSQGNVLAASMGYFLNPLTNVALGVLVLRERLLPGQWLAVGLAGLGVIEMAVATGVTPWSSLALAASFSIYGLLRKLLPVSPLAGLAVETGLLAPLALAYLAMRATEGSPVLGGEPAIAAALLAGGPVTALPLLWFAAAASRLRYSTLGFFQYLAPTGHFLLAVLAYGEIPEGHQLFAFTCIWAAIAVYLWAGRRAGTAPH